MEHFSEQAWADLIRGLRNSESDKIEAHLAGNCAECRRVYDTWDRVHTVMLREKLYSTPEHLARMAKLEFVSRQEFNAAPAVLATLTFDSFTRPAQAGIRSAAAAARQMVYETDGLAVDLRFDHSPTGKLVLVTGQVLDKLGQ